MLKQFTSHASHSRSVSACAECPCLLFARLNAAVLKQFTSHARLSQSASACAECPCLLFACLLVLVLKQLHCTSNASLSQSVSLPTNLNLPDVLSVCLSACLPLFPGNCLHLASLQRTNGNIAQTWLVCFARVFSIV